MTQDMKPGETKSAGSDNSFTPLASPDSKAAHEFLCEFRTRISTQPLPYQHGIESRALESLWEIFAQARSAMKNNPGCETFARITTEMLNLDLRPVTSKWHRAYADGQLNSRDGANDFRADLEQLRRKLRTFAETLHELAYASPGLDAETPPAMSKQAVEKLFGNLKPGIPGNNSLIDSDITHRINEAEANAMKRRRKHYEIKGQNNAVGLGLSGGGIRSATFCLGVVQVLASKVLFRHVDFLSTVSGGGYLGTFLSTVVKDEKSEAQIANPHGPDTPLVLHLRQGAKYLAASNLKERWLMVTEILAGMVLNWTAPLFFIALVALVATLNPFDAIPWESLFTLLFIINFGFLIAYGYRMRYHRRTWGLGLGLSLATAVVFVAVWIVTQLYGYFWRDSFSFNPTLAVIAAVGAAALPTVLRLVPIVNTTRAQQIALKLALILVGLMLPIGAIIVILSLYHIGESKLIGPLFLVILTVTFGAIALFVLDINMTAPHRTYKNLLARTFIYDTPETSALPIKDINDSGYAPYHLINAAANLPSSQAKGLRERRSDFFIFSKHWCGAPSLSYAKTEDWQAAGQPIDLATAMAVSGAAASSNMGLKSVAALRALLTFINLRLGYWIKSPKDKNGYEAPGFWCLMREMFGFGMHESANWFNLSDGGHIENMGVYELLRRRCKFIISVDGEADPENTFHGHITLVRHAQIDFGIRIEPDLTEMRPDTASRFSQTHAMMSRIIYPATETEPEGVGLILYMKLSMTGDEIELVKRYRALNPDFPHQTTLDQFFDEEQFEAYRQLGVHVAEGLFHPAVLGNEIAPDNVADWFRSLAANLLLPDEEEATKGKG